jgi:DNA-directed RNA polymerase subunit beta'
MNQIRQLAGMRGLMANTAGKTIEIPIKASLREGLTVLEYFTSARGARKGLTDTALRTADSGYLTRRLVDVSQDVIIREHDCGTHEGIKASGAETVTSRDFNDYAKFAESLRGRVAAAPIYDVYTGEVLVGKGVKIEAEGAAAISTHNVERVLLRPEDNSYGELIHGRYPAEDILSAKTGEVLFTRNDMLSSSDAATLEEHDVFEIIVRSVLDCESASGVCVRCYGINLATGSPVSIGEAVGVIAAQSIGEPGTQLTMRTFHTGGIAGDDITQGLPRVEELFEARKPKKMSILSETDGRVSIEETRRNSIVAINVVNPLNEEEFRVYQAPYSAGIRVGTGDTVARGDRLTDGALNPHDVMRIRGKNATQTYLINEVQKVYGQHGVDINDKHIEVIVRQMMRKVRIDDGGDTPLLGSTVVDILDLRRENSAINARIAAGETELRPAVYSQLLMGITKASLATESFLSAASFQETTKVLTGAAIKGKVDRLVGLKENVIIGKLLPAGSGLSIYRKFDSEHTDALDIAAEDDVDLSVLIGTTNAI